MTVIDDSQMSEIRAVCPEASAMQEGGVTYIFLAKLHLPGGCDPSEVEALLRPEPGPDGYSTRLFLSHPFPSKGQNWTVHRILDKTWHTFSYNHVPPDLRLIEILANHLKVLR
jgi:hypothetical protein